MNSISLVNKLSFKIVFNILSGSIIIAIPLISHTSGFPFYVLEPMRILILLYFIISNDKNKYFLAVGLPLLSYLVTGHPVLYKLPLVALDLSMNLVILSFFQRYRLNDYLAIIFSIIISKVIYYIMKYFFLNFHLLDGNLIDTNIYFQVINITVVLIILLLYSLRKNNV